MKKIIIILILGSARLQSLGQIPLTGIISTVVNKIINTLDLEVEKLQNQTIWLQDAQKTLENSMSQIQLDEISSWVQQTKNLYSEYYQELSTVKQVIADYDKVKQIVSLQANILSAYQNAYAKFRQDTHFSPSEINYMYTVYSGIISQSLNNVEQILLVVNPFVTQMSDAGRVIRINKAEANIQRNYNDLKAFNNQNITLSLQRSTGINEIQTVKNLYGLP